MKYRELVLAGVSALCLGGCASLMEGSSQMVGVSTKPVEGALCTLKNERGSWTVTTPGSVEVKRSTTDLEIVCKKDGWQDATGRLVSRTSDGTTITALLWGPIGVGVDAATGASFHYPAGIELPMVPVAAPPAAPVAPPAVTPAAAPPAKP